MYCPRCGQGQSHENTSFCSRCGFLMAGMGEFVRNGGLPVRFQSGAGPDAVSPKKKGLKQGGIMFLSGFIVVPALAILSEMFNVEPVIAGVAALVLFWGGILRMIYALIFQTGQLTAPEKAGFVDSLRETFLGKERNLGQLPQGQPGPAQQGFEAGAFSWRETDDLDAVPREGNSTNRFTGR
ncbi:MAG: hypothetical protein OEM82_05000 [Acidobacteriota bacterium]|nr:hypothetical protein [Acidobacteriota bacterium]MDH3529736.1 hypothetical protein [Acidobacteriota bacterium]